MKKGYGIVLLILVILLAVYNIIVYDLQLPKTISFYSTYVFTTLAILIQIGIVYFAFKTDNNKSKSIFLGLPTAYVGGIHLFLQLVWSAVVMTSANVATSPAIVVSVILLVLCLISVITTSVSKT
jgi:hypothetical protein